MPEAQETRLIIFHCPNDARTEMDTLCELNMIDRTEFLLQAIYKMMDYLESRRDALDDESLDTYPDMDEKLFMAAEDSADEQ